MKTLIYLFIGALLGNCAIAQDSTAPQWNATIKVIDEDGQPISGAHAVVGYYVSPTGGQDNINTVAGDNISGLTAADGIFKASHQDRSAFLNFVAEKEGYYTTRVEYTLGAPSQYDSAKWNPTVTLVLKKIGKPIAMYAKWVYSDPPIFKKTGQPPISFDESIGYDLVVGDWVAPYGKGTNTDIIFGEQFDKKSVTDYYYKQTISFPNAGDGIQEFSVPDTEKGSDLRSPHEAPADGYESRLIRENYHHPGQVGESDYDENRIYLFRMTLPDGLHYGKIYGDPIQMNFRYYLNPTPNDRNIEFDPKQNLSRGLKPFERVTSP
jgi:hypothetical protein